MTHHGDVAVKMQWNGKNKRYHSPCIDATNQLTLQANKIQLGHDISVNKTQDFQVTSTRVDLGKPIMILIILI